MGVAGMRFASFGGNRYEAPKAHAHPIVSPVSAHLFCICVVEKMKPAARLLVSRFNPWGQAQPVAIFVLALTAVVFLDGHLTEPLVSRSAAGHGRGQGPAGPSLPPLPCVFDAWALFQRLLALIFTVSFASLRGQIVPLAGAIGLFPAGRMLRRARQDMGSAGPSARLFRWLSIPAGLFWLSDASDWSLRLAVNAGICASLCAFYGGGGQARQN